MPTVLSPETYERVLSAVNDGLDRLYDHFPFDPNDEPGHVTYDRVFAWICSDHGVTVAALKASMTYYGNLR